MTAKEYLGQIRLCQRKIKQKEKQREMLRDDVVLLEGIRYDRDKVQTSPKDNIAEMVAQLVDRENEIIQDVVSCNALINQAIDLIQGIDNIDYVDCLFRRYVEGYNFETIAVDMHLSYYRVCHLHGEALRYFEEKYPDVLQS